MPKYSAQYTYSISSAYVGRIYKVILNGDSIHGIVMIAITHPYYGSLTTCFIPRDSGSGALSSSNTLGSYRGAYKLYTDDTSLYFKVNNSGADKLVITPLSYISISVEDATDTIDESLLTAI